MVQIEDEAMPDRHDVAIFTASSLVNGTNGDLPCYSSKARSIGLYGPSVSTVSDCLFRHVVDCDALPVCDLESSMDAFTFKIRERH
jgi:uncharacterized protein (DUF4213/DUF364 family)